LDLTRALPGRAADRFGDPPDLDSRVPRLRHPAADARMGPHHRRGPQLRRHRLVADRAARPRRHGHRAGHPPDRQHPAKGDIMIGSPLLSIDGLTVDYSRRGSSPAVSDLDLTVASGAMTAVVGESGSGKSTTANAVIGLLPSSARSEEHTSELQSRFDLVCRLLLE